MLFPIIKIKDRDYEPTIVGENIHDRLYIDEETGGIHYINLQTFGGTEGENEYKFIPRDIDPLEKDWREIEMKEIEMVNFGKLMEIYFKDADEEIKEIMNKALEDIEKIKDKNIEYFEKEAEGLVMSGVMIDFKSRKKLDERIQLIKLFNKFREAEMKEAEE